MQQNYTAAEAINGQMVLVVERKDQIESLRDKSGWGLIMVIANLLYVLCWISLKL